MRAHPHERFLGVPANADAATLLDVDAATVNSAGIDAALRQRLAQVSRHPGGASPDAENVRNALKSAADTLRELIKSGQRPVATTHSLPGQRATRPGASRSMPQSRGARPGITLTSFDRQVLGTLVGCGGWNHASRARLVSIAGAHRVTVHGLLTVIHGLNDYARSGGARLDVATITAGQRSLAPAVADEPRRATVSLAERLLPELKDPTPATTVKWSLIFGFAAFIVGILLIAIVMGNADHGRGEDTSSGVSDEVPIIADNGATDGQGNNLAELSREPATFAEPPTFAVDIDSIIPDSLVTEAGGLPEEFRHVAARVHVSAAPAEAVYHDWEALTDLASRTWLRLDTPLEKDIIAAVREVLAECAEKPSVSDRLLDALAIPDGRVVKPIDMASRVWRIRTLAELAQSLRLSLAVREKSEQLLAAVLPEDAEVRTQAPVELALAYLHARLGTMTSELSTDTDAFGTWEIWLNAVHSLASNDGAQSLVLDAIGEILRDSADLAHQSADVRVLGRLLEESDWTNSEVVKQRMAVWFDDTEHVKSANLWVLTSILSERGLARWFNPNLILPALADASHRRRVRDQITSAWPTMSEEGPVLAGPAGGGVAVDPQLAKQWKTLQAELLAAPFIQQPEGLASQLAILTRLNEAASHLENGDITNAELVMDWIDHARVSESIFDGTSALSRPRGPFMIGRGANGPGQAIGPDGVWAQAYTQVGSNSDERIKLLRALRSTAGTDLGPMDASAFVREVYRATPAEVRSMAQSVALMFSNGPGVCQQLLDQLPDAVTNEATSELLQRVTGKTLPQARSEQWRIDARLALISHCLVLLHSNEVNIDRAADIIADAVANQGPTADHDLAQEAAHETPAESAELIRSAWAASVRGVVVAEPVPGDVLSIERRQRTRKQLAKGPIQSFVASRIGHLELFAFTMTAEQPALRVTVSNMLSASSLARANMTDALQQAIEVERVLSNLHVLRMQYERAANGGQP